MEIQIATLEDIEILAKHDRHIAKEEWKNIIPLKRAYIARENGQFVGWMRYGLFWDNTPFCNMLFLLDGQREKGYGRQINGTLGTGYEGTGVSLYYDFHSIK